MAQFASNRFLRKIAHFLVVFGPGWVTMEADNDFGAVSSYTQAGAQYGLHGLLWLLLILLPITYICQEMVVRLGICTGKGYVVMIYKRFGKFWGNLSIVNLLVVNMLTLVTEFAGISLVMAQLGVSPYWSVPLVAVALIILVLSSGYSRWERCMIVLCLLDVVWLLVACLHRNCPGTPVIPGIPVNGTFLFMVIAVIGTTVAPWQLAFQQSAICNKKLRFKDLKLEQLDTFLGAVFTIIIAGAMMYMGRCVGGAYKDPGNMAHILGTRWGHNIGTLLLLMGCNAAILGTVAISLASAWAFGEIKGWPHSLQLSFKEAKGFYGIYSGCVLSAAGIVLIPHLPLQLVIVSVQVLAALILPSALIFLQLLLNDKTLMRDYRNSKLQSVIGWVVVGLLIGLSVLLILQPFLGAIHI